MGRLKGVPQTGVVATKRRENKGRREAHQEAMVAGTVSHDLPAPRVPELFRDLQATYWQGLKTVPDPRSPGNIVSPL